MKIWYIIHPLLNNSHWRFDMLIPWGSNMSGMRLFSNRKLLISVPWSENIISAFWVKLSFSCFWNALLNPLSTLEHQTKTLKKNHRNLKKVAGTEDDPEHNIDPGLLLYLLYMTAAVFNSTWWVRLLLTFSLSSLVNLEVLITSHNDFSEGMDPDIFKNMKSLRKLTLSWNKMSRLPARYYGTT